MSKEQGARSKEGELRSAATLFVAHADTHRSLLTAHCSAPEGGI